MTRKFRLKKDLPVVEAGAIFYPHQDDVWKWYSPGAATFPKIIAYHVENSPDWFEEIKEEPVKKDPWDEGNYEEVPIKDIKVGDIVSYHKYSIFSKVRAVDTKISIVHEYDDGKIELQNYCDDDGLYRPKTTQEAPKKELWFKPGDKIRLKSGMRSMKYFMWSGEFSENGRFLGTGYYSDDGFVEMDSYATCQDQSQWEFYQEPLKEKKTVKMWPALFSIAIGFPCVSKILFTNEEAAKTFARLSKNDFISWPAIPNADGSYDVPMEVE